MRIRDVMTSPVVTIDPDASCAEARARMRGRGIGCLPVVDRDVLVGIVTISDLLGLLADGALPSLTAERRLRARRTAAIRRAPIRA